MERISLVIPTLNEAENMLRLLHLIGRALRHHDHEVIVVDDQSDDGTADQARANVHRVRALRVVERTAERGLSASVVDGFRVANGDVVMVMDADLQHDARILPKLIAALDRSDIAIGSRYAFKGKTCGWSRLREAESRMAAALTRRVLGLSVKDPLSGFFALRREVFDSIEPRLRLEGWKILLEVLGQAPWADAAEVPFTFRPRRHGKTKMSGAVVKSWLRQLYRLRRERAVAWSTRPGFASRLIKATEVVA